MVSGDFNWVSNFPEASDRRMRLSVFVFIWMVAPSMGWRRESRRIPLMGVCAIRLVVNSNRIAVSFCISVMVSRVNRGTMGEVRKGGCSRNAGEGGVDGVGRSGWCLMQLYK